MFCIVALICLLDITAIKARSIDNYNCPTHPAQSTNEFYSEAVISDYNPKLPAWQFRDERPALYEKVERLAPQPCPYEVVNRVLPKLEEPTDFQPLESQLSAQEKQITHVPDDVKNVQRTVTELEKYLKSATAALVPQNKAKNGAIRISKKMPKHDEVHGEDSKETDSGEMEVELDVLMSSSLEEDSNESDSGEMEVELDVLMSSSFEEDSKETDSGEMEVELDVLMSSAFEEDSNESDSGDMEVELDVLMSSSFEEDSNESDSGEMEKELRLADL